MLGVVALATPVGGRLVALANPTAPGGATRVDEWRVAGRVLVAHPVTGVGPEGYRIAFAEGVDEAYERRHGRDPLPDRAHAGPLDPEPAVRLALLHRDRSAAEAAVARARRRAPADPRVAEVQATVRSAP